jgi:ABC-2 type transport system permease protein
VKDTKKEVSGNNFFGNIKKSFSGRKFKSGAYVTMVSAVVIVIILVANMLISKMNLQVDLSEQGMYTLSEDTQNMLGDLKDDVTIYYMVKAGDEVDQFKNIVNKYDATSDKVKLVYKDPVLYPKFAAKYVDSTVSENSFLVVNNKTKVAKYVDYSEMLIQEMDPSTYQNQTTGIDVEGKLTSAIQYVTTTERPKLYTLEGHGEAAVGTTFSSTIDKLNIETASLSTAKVKSIPEDCNILYINAPQTDFTTDEVTMLEDYFAKGGKALITLDYKAYSLPNFVSVLDYYGIKMAEGIVLEGDSNMHAADYVNYLFPNVESSDITSQASNSGTLTFMPVASGLTISDKLRSTLKVDPLLTTSASSYAKTSEQSTTVEKESGDIDGPFNLGLVVTDTYNDQTAKLVVYSAGAYTFGDETASYANPKLLTGSIGYLIGNTDLLSIPTKSLGQTPVTVTSQQALLIGAVVILIIPIFILTIGGVICYRRRRK